MIINDEGPRQLTLLLAHSPTWPGWKFPLSSPLFASSRPLLRLFTTVCFLLSIYSFLNAVTDKTDEAARVQVDGKPIIHGIKFHNFVARGLFERSIDKSESILSHLAGLKDLSLPLCYPRFFVISHAPRRTWTSCHENRFVLYLFSGGVTRQPWRNVRLKKMRPNQVIMSQNQISYSPFEEGENGETEQDSASKPKEVYTEIVNGSVCKKGKCDNIGTFLLFGDKTNWRLDFDDDGIPNDMDFDRDGDELMDVNGTSPFDPAWIKRPDADNDNDGVPNEKDEDEDNDGISGRLCILPGRSNMKRCRRYWLILGISVCFIIHEKL